MSCSILDELACALEKQAQMSEPAEPAAESVKEIRTIEKPSLINRLLKVKITSGEMKEGDYIAKGDIIVGKIARIERHNDGTSTLGVIVANAADVPDIEGSPLSIATPPVAESIAPAEYVEPVVVKQKPTPEVPERIGWTEIQDGSLHIQDLRNQLLLEKLIEEAISDPAFKGDLVAFVKLKSPRHLKRWLDTPRAAPLVCKVVQGFIY